MTDYSSKIARGARLLDALYPAWESRINPTTLEISSLNECPYAQASGHTFSAFWDDADKYNGEGWAVHSHEFGFSINVAQLPQYVTHAQWWDAYKAEEENLKSQWLTFIDSRKPKSDPFSCSLSASR